MEAGFARPRRRLRSPRRRLSLRSRQSGNRHPLKPADAGGDGEGNPCTANISACMYVLYRNFGGQVDSQGLPTGKGFRYTGAPQTCTCGMCTNLIDGTAFAPGVVPVPVPAGVTGTVQVFSPGSCGAGVSAGLSQSEVDELNSSDGAGAVPQPGRSRPSWTVRIDDH